MVNDKPTSAQESWVIAAAERSAKREQRNSEHRERYIGKRAEVVVDIAVPHGAETIHIASIGDIVDIIDADIFNPWYQDVEIRTAEGTEAWVDSMCLSLQE